MGNASNGVAGQQKEKRKLGVTTLILISLALGVIAGIVLNLLVAKDTWFAQAIIGGKLPGADGTQYGLLYVIGQLFIRLMQMLVVPLVFCSIVCGAASMSDPKMLGKVGLGTIVSYLVTTMFAVIIALLLATWLRPGVGLDMNAIVQGDVSAKSADPFGLVILNIIPTNIVSAMADGSMLPIIVFALILGFILGALGRKVATVNRFFTQFNAVMMKMVSLVLKVAPLGIFCLISVSFYGLGIDGILPMIKFIGVVYLGLLVQLLVVYMGILTLVGRVNPIHFLRKFWPVMVFAFSTSSSNATIPLNLETLKSRLGVDGKVASFTIPLGATINMDGTAIMQGAAVIFACQAFNIDLGLSGMVTVILTATMASIGTAGVPGVGTLMTMMVFNSVGLPSEGIAMIMGIDRILDMGRTTINITGDAVVTTVMARLVGMLDVKTYEDDSIAAVDLDKLETSGEPQDFDDFSEHGEPVEIGELGDPDKFEHVADPNAK